MKTTLFLSRYIKNLLLLIAFFLFLPHAPICDAADSFKRPTHINSNVWSQIAPYLLPFNHPAKAKLDKIFNAARVITNSDTIAEAGFLKPHPRPYSKTIVTKHPSIKGYWMKFFSDAQTEKTDWKEFLKRINGANAIKKGIKDHGYESYFTVPHKWIYVLPEKWAPKGAHRKSFILVVEEMKILPKKENYKKWKSAAMTPARVKALYTLINELGLNDSVRAFNLPFTLDNKLAFIDTERHHHWPIHFSVMAHYLSKPMGRYLRSISHKK